MSRLLAVLSLTKFNTAASERMAIGNEPPKRHDKTKECIVLEQNHSGQKRPCLCRVARLHGSQPRNGLRNGECAVGKTIATSGPVSAS